jgi:hypothetical protein
MAEGLFDNRYRYDYIYPRGRSGETLRAVDTQDGERAVVIKRPAPQDAPPIRAGQEVSILTERKALQKLAGQPALTAYLGGGQFSVGGISHQYIVMERAEGQILAEMILDMAGRGERFPELEMLIIVDALLELLEAAHEQEIVYNDVDAKHLFWDREQYRLKLIDWGNAVFLDGDESTPQGISRQSDVYQVGELLYFIVTGGGRVEVPRGVAQNAGEEFRLSFGEDGERLHSRLQTIISRAAHPNSRLRYRTIADLRRELSDYRAPMERDRTSLIDRVNNRLKRELSRDELNSLVRTLEPTLAHDPGYPPARQTETEIYARLSDLQVAADLDAARIYLESGGWTRALSVLEELRPRARGEMATLIALLLDWATILAERQPPPSPQILAVQEALALMFEDDAAEAARVLVMQTDSDDRGLATQWLLAERISAHIPEIMLLRPNLYRLQVALATLTSEGVIVSEPRALLNETNATLDRLLGSSAISVIALRDGCRTVVDQLTALNHLLDAVQTAHQFPNRLLPLSALTRALNAAMALADNMHVIGKQATTSPRDALGALDHCREIVPAAPAWEEVARFLDSLYQKLGTYQTFVPAADGADVAAWLTAAETELRPFAEALFDEDLTNSVNNLRTAALSWENYDQAAVQGSKINAVAALTETVDNVAIISPSLSNWFNQLRAVVSNASYVERHALFGALGRALADGWEHFDRGRLADAERLGLQALEAAQTDLARRAARRLRDLAQISREWVERGGILDHRRTQTTLNTVEMLYTAEETTLRDSFAKQMPSKETYLKAMSKGLVEGLSKMGTAPVRLYFFTAVLYGALDAQEDSMDDALFWRDVAVKVLPDNGTRHVLARSLEEFVQRRRDLDAASALLNTLNNATALPSLERTRRALEENGQARVLQPAIFSLRELEAALRDWTDGEFRSAGMKLENAVKALDELETSAQITLTGYRAWLMGMLSRAADLHANARKLVTAVEALPDQPTDDVREAHEVPVDVTLDTLGDTYVGTLRQWEEMYTHFSSIYADRTIRRSAKLNRLNEALGAMFIDRHPAYPLYRHWYSLVEQSPEFPAPPTSEPTPRISEGDEGNVEPPVLVRADDQQRKRRRLSPLLIILSLLLVIAVVAVLITSGGGAGDGTETTPDSLALAATDDVTAADTQDATAGVMATDSDATVTLAASIAITVSPDQATRAFPSGLPSLPPAVEETAVMTDTATSIPTPLAVLATIAPRGSETITLTRTRSATPSRTPSPSNTPTRTPTVTFTPSITRTPAPTLPPTGLQGEQSLLALAAAQPETLLNEDIFSPVLDGEQWRLGLGGLGTGGEVLIVAPTAALLDEVYGNDAATRITRTSASLDLQTYNPPLLVDGDVYYGILLQNADDPAQVVGLQIDQVEAGMIRLSLVEGTELTPISQRSDNGGALDVRLERDLDQETILVYVNDQLLGASLSFVGVDVPVIPALYVHDGGVIVYVSDWTVTLR